MVLHVNYEYFVCDVCAVIRDYYVFLFIYISSIKFCIIISPKIL